MFDVSIQLANHIGKVAEAEKNFRLGSPLLSFDVTHRIISCPHQTC